MRALIDVRNTQDTMRQSRNSRSPPQQFDAHWEQMDLVPPSFFWSFSSFRQQVQTNSSVLERQLWPIKRQIQVRVVNFLHKKCYRNSCIFTRELFSTDKGYWNRSIGPNTLVGKKLPNEITEPAAYLVHILIVKVQSPTPALLLEANKNDNDNNKK